MKKVLLSLIVAGMGIVSAQTISFEQEEGYFPGNIHGQNGWVTDHAGVDLPMQEIVTSEASHGVQSFMNAFIPDFQNDTDPETGGAVYPTVFGAQHTPETPIAVGDDFAMSYDFKGEWDGDHSDFYIRLWSEDPTDPESLTVFQQFDFGYTGTFVYVGYNAEGNLAYTTLDGFAWESNVWNNVLVQRSGDVFNITINGMPYGTIPVISTTPIARIDIVNDNWGFDAYYDNIRFNADVLAVNDLNSNASFSTIFPNPARDVVNINLSKDFNASKTKIAVSNMMGQTVANFTNTTQIDIAKLPAGVYVLTITDGVKTETKKIIKK